LVLNQGFEIILQIFFENSSSLMDWKFLFHGKFLFHDL
jgi:hypothetical protein